MSKPRRLVVEAGRADWWDRTALGVVHVGRGGVLLDSGSHLHLVADVERGLTPDGAVLPHQVDFAAVRLAALTAQRTQRPLFLGSWCGLPPQAVDRRSLRLAATAPAPTAAGVSALAQTLEELPASPTSGLRPEPVRALGPVLVTAALRSDRRTQNAALAALIGAGPGATPTGDDVVIGILAGLDALADTDPRSDDAARAIAAALAPLLPRTTRASGQELAAAAAGRFSTHVHRLVAATADPSTARQVALAATQWGATSGRDLASGLISGLRAARFTDIAALTALPEQRSA